MILANEYWSTTLLLV